MTVTPPRTADAPGEPPRRLGPVLASASVTDTDVIEREPHPAGRRGRGERPRWWLYIVLTVGLVVMIMPFVWMILGAFKTDAEIRRNNAQSDLVAARARVATARQQQQRTEVRAPFDGVVSDRKVSPGDSAQIGKELIKVMDPASMRFEGLVSADRMAELKLGQTVYFRVNGYPQVDFQGKVRRIAQAANASTRQVEVLVDFADKNLPRVAGLFAEGRIEAETTSALMVPESALVKQGDTTYVWKIKDKALSKATLQMGARDARSGNWQVQSGLAKGDIVMRTPASGFRDGQKVDLQMNKAVASASVPANAVKGN